MCELRATWAVATESTYAMDEIRSATQPFLWLALLCWAMMHSGFALAQSGSTGFGSALPVSTFHDLEPLEEMALDNPVTVVLAGSSVVAKSKAAGNPQVEFKARLALARAYFELSDFAQHKQQLDAAQKLLASEPLGEAERILLAAAQLEFLDKTGLPTPVDFQSQVDALRIAGINQGANGAVCALNLTEAIHYANTGEVVLSWRAALRLEACALALKDVSYYLEALSYMGDSAGRVTRDESADKYYMRILETLGDKPRRYTRFMALHNLGRTHRYRGNYATSEALILEGIRLVSEIGIGSKTRRARLGLAYTYMDMKDWRQSLQQAELAMGNPGDEKSNRVLGQVHAVRVKAMAELRHSGLLTAMNAAIDLDRHGLSPNIRSALDLAIASAQASLGNHPAAYQLSSSVVNAIDAGVRQARERAAVTLQTQYESAGREVARARRDAENADAPLRAMESAALLLGLSTACGLLGGLAGLAVLWQWRRVHARCLLGTDMATRLPDRNALWLMARRQQRLSRSLSQSLLLATVRLESGDVGNADREVSMKLLADVLRTTLRQGDNVGRLSYDAFALVLPGMGDEELASLVGRTRQALQDKIKRGDSAACMPELMWASAYCSENSPSELRRLFARTQAKPRARSPVGEGRIALRTG